MRKLIHTLFVLVITLGFGCTKSKQDTSQWVNPILGDKSFIETFGYAPDASTDNELRITTHLVYVEELLSKKDVGHLNAQQIAKRNHLLHLLHEYHTAGIFPRNYDYEGVRKPCFIDGDGRICAVGYLVEQTAGRDAAEHINSKFKYEDLINMDDTLLDAWIADCGLTKEELAMIQPTYDWYDVKQPIMLGVRRCFGLAMVGSGKNLDVGHIPVASFGITCGWPIESKLALFTDLLFSKKGYSNDLIVTNETGNPTGQVLQFKNKYTYLTMPLRFGFRVLRRHALTASIGVAPSVALSAKWTHPAFEANGLSVEAESVNQIDDVKRFDLAAVAEVGYGFNLTGAVQLVASIGYDYSLTNIYPNPENGAWLRHRVANAGLALRYNVARKTEGGF